MDQQDYDSDLSDLASALAQAEPDDRRSPFRCNRCGEFEAESVFAMAKHNRKCKLKRRAAEEKRLQEEGVVSLHMCLLMRQHLHVPVSSFDVVGSSRFLIGGVEAVRDLSFGSGDGVVNCAEELKSAIREDILTLFCPAQDSESFEIIPLFAESVAAFVKENPSRRILFHCAAGQSRSATLCLAAMMLTVGMSLLEAWTAVKTAREIAYPNRGFFLQLIELEFK